MKSMVNLFVDHEFHCRFVFCSSIMNSVVSLCVWTWIPLSAMGVIFHCHISWIFFFLFSVMSWISFCQLTNTVRMQVVYSTSRKTTQGACAGANSFWGWGQRRTDHSRLLRWCQRCRRHLSASREGDQALSTSVPWGAGGRLTLQCICYHTNCLTIFALPSFLHWVSEFLDCRCMISYMISWSRIYDIVYDFIGLWYHKS